MTVTPVLATAGAEAKEVKPGASAVAFVAWPLLLAIGILISSKEEVPDWARRLHRFCAGPAG
jgi:hypothetical protein